MRFIFGILVAAMTVGQRAFADSITFDPPEANALTPMIITVDGFIGTNGPRPVTVSGPSFSYSCTTARPCTHSVNMGNFPGTYWVKASATVNGHSVVISNFFTVRYPEAYLNRACGTNGTKVLVTGDNFGRNDTVYVGNVATTADEKGRFAKLITINGPVGPYKIISQDGFRFATNEFNIGLTNVCEEDIGHAPDLRGCVTIRRPGGQPQPLNSGDAIHLGDEIRTCAEGKARLAFHDGTTLTLGQNANVIVGTQIFDPANPQNDESKFSILEGAFRYVSGLVAKKPDNNVNVNTPYGNIGIRGTDFISRRDPCSTTQEVYLIHGQLAIKSLYAAATNIVDAPATILYDATNVWTNVLTQAAYDTLASELNQTNLVTFAAWQVQYFGCANNNASALATADPDGDGQNNYAEFLARTDPTTNASVFKLIGATREGDGVRLFWQTHGGITNVVQAAANLDGSFSNISPNIGIPSDADVTTNYFDAGVITNAPARFYRVRLVP